MELLCWVTDNAGSCPVSFTDQQGGGTRAAPRQLARTVTDGWNSSAWNYIFQLFYTGWHWIFVYLHQKEETPIQTDTAGWICDAPTENVQKTFSGEVIWCKLQLVPNGDSPFVFPPAPCAPRNVSALLVCDNNTAAVSWQHSAGAVSYKVRANGRDGDVKECTTNGTRCLLPNMHCAQTYVIMVSPFSKYCKGFDSNPLSYTAGEVELEKLHA